MNKLSVAIGISRPTLARYFENETSVLPSTAAKIKTALDNVDYVYNFLATRQNRKTTGLIGVIIPQFKDLFYASLLDSIEAAAREAGYTVITQCSHGAAESEEIAVRKLRSMNVDGTIIAPLGVSESSTSFAEARGDFPIVFADSRPASFPSKADFVGTNNANSIGCMVDYLCRTGAAPLFLPMPELNSNALERQEAYFHRMSELGLKGELIPVPAEKTSWRFERFGLEVMDSHFAQGRYLNATILCANDRIAIGAIRAANTYGLFARPEENGGDLRIAGHDDHPMSQYSFPAITTVAQEVEGIGQDAVRLLIDRVQNGRDGDSATLLRDGVLKIRESA